jgi:hypothetical protein
MADTSTEARVDQLKDRLLDPSITDDEIKRTEKLIDTLREQD